MEAGLIQKVTHSVAREPIEVVRRLVDFPFLRHNHEDARARLEDSSKLGQCARRILYVLQCDDVDSRIEAGGRKRETRKIGENIEPAVIPRIVADCQVNAAVAMLGKVVLVSALASAGIEHPGALRETGSKILRGPFDGCLKMQNMPAQPARHAPL